MHVVEDMVGKQGESKWAEGVGHRGAWVCAAKVLVPVARQHHRTPPPGGEYQG